MRSSSRRLLLSEQAASDAGEPAIGSPLHFRLKKVWIRSSAWDTCLLGVKRPDLTRCGVNQEVLRPGAAEMVSASRVRRGCRSNSECGQHANAKPEEGTFEVNFCVHNFAGDGRQFTYPAKPQQATSPRPTVPPVDVHFRRGGL